MKKIFIVGFSILFWSCRASMTIPKNTDLVDFIIEDYYATNQAYITKYNYFEVEKAENDKCVGLYRISPSHNNYYVPTIEYNLFDIYPTSYKVIQGKTFLWRNSQDMFPSMEVMNFLHSKNLIDSSYLKYQRGEIHEDSVKGHPLIKNGERETVNYLFCRNKPDNIKRKLNVPAYYSFTWLLKKGKCKCD